MSARRGFSIRRTSPDLMRSGKVRARRVRLPLVHNSRTAAEAEFSPERVAAILQDAEVTDLTTPGLSSEAGP